MYRDEFLFDHLRNKDSDDTILRFYSFDPPCLSLGRFQKHYNKKAALELGLEIVRRPTGGRAVIHKHEITYSLVFNWKNSIFSGNIRESYRKISNVFCKAFRQLGIPVELASIKKSDYQNKIDCFVSPSYFELILNNSKIMGSAQLRKRDWCLQHGSLILKKEPIIYEKLFGRYEEYPDINIDIEDFKETVINAIKKEYDMDIVRYSFNDLIEEFSCEK